MGFSVFAQGATWIYYLIYIQVDYLWLLHSRFKEWSILALPVLEKSGMILRGSVRSGIHCGEKGS